MTMKMYERSDSTRRSSEPLVVLRESGIAFNAPLARIVGDHSHVLVGYDDDTQEVLFEFTNNKKNPNALVLASDGGRLDKATQGRIIQCRGLYAKVPWLASAVEWEATERRFSPKRGAAANIWTIVVVKKKRQR